MVNFADILAPKFDELKAYKAHVFVIYNNRFYISLQKTGPGAFNPDHWLEAWAVDLLGQDPYIVTGKAYLTPVLSANHGSASKTYNIKDLIPDGIIPRFVTGRLGNASDWLSIDLHFGETVGEADSYSDSQSAGSVSYDAAKGTLTHSVEGHSYDDEKDFDNEGWGDVHYSGTIDEQVLIIIDA